MRLPALLPRLLATTALTTAGLLPATLVLANPSGGTVVGGEATITATGNVTTIHQGSDRAAIDWQGFSVGRNETTRFVQPSDHSVALNRVTGPDASVIDGKLDANGIVYLINQNGVMVGNGAEVRVGGFVATTSDLDTGDFMRGRDVFDRPTANPQARVVNRGQITVGAKGLVGLVAPGVENDGVIAASVGTVAMGSAETFTVDLAGDGLIAFDTGAQVATGGGTQVVQAGRIVNPGGRVLLTAAQAKGVVDGAIDMSGVIEAKSVGLDRGVIILAGADGATTVSGRLDSSGGAVAVSGRDVTLTANSVIDVSAGRRGDGGTVSVGAGRQAVVAGTVRARGGATGGTGGAIETSSKTRIQVAGATIDASAPAGTAGTWLIDPVDAVLTSNPTDPIDIDLATVVAALNSGTDVTVTTVGAGADSGIITLGKPTDFDSNIVTTIGGDGFAVLALEANRFIQLSGAFGITNQGGVLGLNLKMVKDPANGPATGGDINIGRVTADGGDIFLAADASGVKDEGGRVFFSGDVTTINGGQMSLFAYGNTIEVDQRIDIDALSLSGLDLSAFGLDSSMLAAGATFAAFAPIANPRIEFGPVFVTGNVSSITIRDGLDATPGVLTIATERLSMAADESSGTLPGLVEAPTVILTGPPGRAVNVQTATSAGGLDIFAEDLVAFDFANIDTLQFGDLSSSLVRLGGTLDGGAMGHSALALRAVSGGGTLDGGAMGHSALALRAVSGGGISVGEAASFSPPDETRIAMGSVALIAGTTAADRIAIGSTVQTTITADSLFLQSGGTQTLADNADTTIAVRAFTSGVDSASGAAAPAAQVIFGGAGSLPGAPLPVTLDFTASDTTRILSADAVVFADRANGQVLFNTGTLAIGDLVGNSSGYTTTLTTGPVTLGNGGMLDMIVDQARIASSALTVNNDNSVAIHGFSSVIAFDGGAGGTAAIGRGGSSAVTGLTGAGSASEIILDYGSIQVGDPSGLGGTMLDAAFIALNASSGDLTVAPGAAVSGTESVTFALNDGGRLQLAGDVAGGLAILAPYAAGQDVLINTDSPAQSLFTQDNIDALTNFDQLIITTATGTGFVGAPAGTSTLTIGGTTPLVLPIDTLIATEFAAGAGNINLGTASRPAHLMAEGNLDVLLASTGKLKLAGTIDTDGGDLAIDAVAAGFDNVILDASLTIDTQGALGNGDVILSGVGAVASGHVADLTLRTGPAGGPPGDRGAIDLTNLEADGSTGIRDLTVVGGMLMADGLQADRDLTVDLAATSATLFVAGIDPALGAGDLHLTVAGTLAGIGLVATGDAVVTSGATIATAAVVVGGDLTLAAQGLAVLTDAAAGIPGTPASRIGGDASISGSAVIIADPASAGFRPITFGGDLTIDAATSVSLFDLTLGHGSLSVTAPQTVLLGDIDTSRDLTIDGSLLLAPDEGAGGGGVSRLASGRDLTVTGAIDAIPGAPGNAPRGLAVTGHTVTLEGPIGSLLPLGSLSVTAGVLIDPPNVTTTGDQFYDAPKTIFTGTDYVTNGGNFVVTGAADFQAADATVDTTGSFAGSPGDIRFAAPGKPQNVHAAGNLTFITRGLLRLAGLIDTDGGDLTIRNRTSGAVNLLIDGDLTIDTAGPGATQGGSLTVRGVGGTSGAPDVTLRMGPASDPDRRGDIDFGNLDFQGLGGSLHDVTVVARDIQAEGMAAGHDLNLDARAIISPSSAVALAAGLAISGGPGSLVATLVADLAGALISATGDAQITGAGTVATSLVQVGGALTLQAGTAAVLADLFAGVPGTPASAIGGNASVSGDTVVIGDPASAGFRPIGFGGSLSVAASGAAALFNLALPGGGLRLAAAQAVLTGDITSRDSQRIDAALTVLGGDLSVTRPGQDLLIDGNLLLARGIGAMARAASRTLSAPGSLAVTGTIDDGGGGRTPLGLVAGADSIALGGVVGGVAPLGRLDLTATTLIDPPNVTTRGDQHYDAPRTVFSGDRYGTLGGAFQVGGSARFDAPSVTIDTTDGSSSGALDLGTGSSAKALSLDAGSGAITARNITLDSLQVFGQTGSAAMTGTIGAVAGEPAALLVDRAGLTTASYLFNGCVMAVGCTGTGPEEGGDDTELPPSAHNDGPPGSDTGDIAGLGPTVQRPTTPAPVVVQTIPSADDDQRFRFSNTGKDQFWRLDVDEPAPDESQP